MAAAEQNVRNQSNPAFRFLVAVNNETQGAFTECTLPTIEWEVEEVKEGGLNTYAHQLPGRRKSARVTLKNGVGKSEMFDWFIANVGESITRKPVTITLLNVKSEPVLSWNLDNAYPLKWTGPQLKSDVNTIAIQTIELACGEVTVNK